MNLQVLVSTMQQTDHCLLKKMNIQSDAIIVNQCDRNDSRKLRWKSLNHKWLNSNERGLSRSRNMAITHATENICLLADDDLVYVDGCKDIVLKQFKQHPEADIITFQVEGIEKTYKHYYPRPRKLNYLTIMRVSSVEMAFRLESIKKIGLKFNILFGAGSKYFSGEENIFLFKCLKNGLKVLYIPLKIADLHIGDSTWFKGYNKDYFISKGAAFTAMSNLFSIPFIIQYTIRKRKLYSNKNTMLAAFKYMLKGRKQYLNELKLKSKKQEK